VQNRKVLIPLLEAYLVRDTTANWVSRMNEAKIPCGPINDMRQVFDDPQVQHRQMVEQIEHPELGSVRLTGLPVKYSSTPGSIRLAPPILGEHTRQVLTEVLGYEESRIAELARQKVIRLHERRQNIS
jgi:crotonobetainyl-CoA:carnitine CoA-transferase CaiB-like acyl-CoA transferase